MKSSPIIKINERNSFSSSKPNIIQPMKLKRKSTQQNEITDLIRNSSKANKQENDYLTENLSKRDDYIRQISKMEGELVRNHDLISSERKQLQIYGGENLLNDSKVEIEATPKENKRSDMNATKVQEAIQNCIILQPFLKCLSEENSKPDFISFMKLLKSVDFESYSILMKSSFSQLRWISECFEIYKEMLKYVETSTFIDNFLIFTQKLFVTNQENLSLFLYDPKTDEYSTYKEEIGYVQLSFKSKPSVMGSILEKKTPEIVSNMLNHPLYSEDVDLFFNRHNHPFFCIPFESNALILLFRPEAPFNNEDYTIGLFYSQLMSPLFEMHVKNTYLKKQIEYQRIYQLFESQLSEKVTFDLLLAYLLSSLNTDVGANDANLFVVENDCFFSFEIEDGQIVKKKFPRTGVPEWIVSNKKHFEIEVLNSSTFEKYDDTIDNWSHGKSFVGFPVFSNKAVIAVLCVSDKSGWNKFNQWDIELIQSISNDLSLIVPKCIENDTSIKKDSIQHSSFPDLIKSFAFPTMEEKNSIEKISIELQKFLDCEWLSIYSALDPISEITKIITLHNGTVIDTNFLEASFIRFAFTNKKTINVANAPKDISNFKTVGDVSSRSLLSVINSLNKEKIGVFAMNSKTENNGGKFENSYASIVEAISGFIIYSMKIKDQNQNILNLKNATMTMTNAFNICESILKDKEPFKKLLDILLELLSMDHYVLLKFNSLKSTFDTLLHSKLVINRGSVKMNDALAFHFSELKNLTFINDFTSCEYRSSSIIDFFPNFKQVLIVRIDPKSLLTCIYAGRNLVSNYDILFQYFMPLLKIYYKNFTLSAEVKFVESDELNRINFYNSMFTDDDLLSVSFDAYSLNDQQKDEAVLKMFSNLNLFKAIGTNLEQFAIFLLKVRHSYNNVPYHNYAHAVDATQIMYIILSKISAKELIFKPIQCAALMLAALLHNVSHEGFDSEFLKKSFSPLVYVYGDKSTLEHFHVSTSVSLLQDFLIFDRSGMNQDELFWLTLKESILATDMSLISDLLNEIQCIETFDKKNENNLLTLCKLLIQVSNIGCLFRPFDINKKIAEKLIEEKKMMNQMATENKISVEEIKKIDQFEIDFIDSVAIPLVSSLCKTDDGTFNFLIERIKGNRVSWAHFSS